MRIRHATLSDLDAIAELERRCFSPAEGADRASFARRLAAYPDRFWLLEDGGRILAMVNGMTTHQSHLADEMYDDAALHNPDGRWQMIFGVACDPDFQHQGYATMTLRRAMEDCRKEGRAGLVLTCHDRLVGFYERFGFQDEGVCDSTHGGASWHEMRLTFAVST